MEAEQLVEVVVMTVGEVAMTEDMIEDWTEGWTEEWTEEVAMKEVEEEEDRPGVPGGEIKQDHHPEVEQRPGGQREDPDWYRLARLQRGLQHG